MVNDAPTSVGVTVEEFVAALKASAERFQAMWNKHVADGNENYPTTLDGHGEWWEQFVAFTDTERTDAGS